MNLKFSVLKFENRARPIFCSMGGGGGGIVSRVLILNTPPPLSNKRKGNILVT